MAILRRCYGRFRPAQIPKEYYELDSYFTYREGSYRGWWLPIDYGFVYYSWSGYYPNSHAFYTTKPRILWKSDLTSYLYIYGILEGGTNKVGALLSGLGTKYVVLRTDVLPQAQIGFWDELSRALNGLRAQEDLKPVFREGNLYAFEVSDNLSYVSAGNLALIFGGYKTLIALYESGIINTANYAFVFADQLNGKQLTELLRFSDLIVFGEMR